MGDKAIANTFVTSGGLFVRLICQATTLVLVARALGPQHYGIFAAIIGVNMLFAPLSGLGFDSVALRESAAHPVSAGSGFYVGLKAILLSAPVLLLLTLLLAVHFLQVALPIWLLVLLATSDLFFVRIIELAAKVYQGQARMTAVALLRLTVPIARLFLALWFSFASDLHSLEGWAMLYFVSSVFGLALAGGYLLMKREWCVTYTKIDRASIKDGLFFATGIVATRAHTDADKPLIMRLDSEYHAGIYAIAYKFYELSVIPVLALFMSNNGALFATFKNGDFGGHFALLQRLAAWGLGYAAIICGCIYFFIEPIVILLAGPDYSDISAVKGVLCWIPFVYSMRQVGEHGLAAQGELPRRSSIQWSVVVCSLAANFALLPIYGWVIAAWVCLASEALLAGLYFISLRRVYRATVSSRP